MNTMLKVIIFFLALILASQVFVIAAAVHNQPRPVPTLNQAISSFSEIDGIIKPALAKYRLSKIILARIHSRDNTDLGMLPTFAVSATNIQTREGVAPNVDQITNSPAAMYGGILAILLTNRSVLVKTADLPNSALRQLLESRNTVEVMFCAVKVEEDRLVGLLAASWDNTDDVPKGEDFRKMTLDLENKANILSRYFGLQPSQEKR